MRKAGRERLVSGRPAGGGDVARAVEIHKTLQHEAPAGETRMFM
jgi:hypothetical protein